MKPFNIKTVLLTVAFFISTAISFSQTIQIATYNNVPFVKISLTNLIQLEQIGFVDFTNLMSSNNYTYQQQDNNYLWQGGGPGAPLFAVIKDAQQSGFIWSNNQLSMINELKDELNRYFVGYENGNNIYRLSNNGRRYKVYLGTNSILLLRQP